MKILLEELSEKQILPIVVNWIRDNNPKFLMNIAILYEKRQKRVFRVCDHQSQILDKINLASERIDCLLYTNHNPTP